MAMVALNGAAGPHCAALFSRDPRDFFHPLRGDFFPAARGTCGSPSREASPPSGTAAIRPAFGSRVWRTAPRCRAGRFSGTRLPHAHRSAEHGPKAEHFLLLDKAVVPCHHILGGRLSGRGSEHRPRLRSFPRLAPAGRRTGPFFSPRNRRFRGPFWEGLF